MLPCYLSLNVCICENTLLNLSQILFLNKNDLFEKRVPVSDIKNFFPVRRYPTKFFGPINLPLSCLSIVHKKDYDGEPGDIRAGRDYFKRRFAKLAQKAGRSKEREIYIQCVPRLLHPAIRRPSYLCSTASHYSITTATDTAMLRVVMAAVEGQLLHALSISPLSS